MSGFANDNDVENPFADPSIAQATMTAKAGLDDYNPFDDQSPKHVKPQSSPAVMQATQEVAPPQYARTGQQTTTTPTISTEEFRRRQEELDRKAEELQRREEELRNTTYNARRNNWPPLPENTFVQPCFYQDISVEIPTEFQRIVRHLYYLWVFHGCVMIVNLIGGMALMIQFGDFNTFGLGILYFLLFTPFSFLCWFRPAYKAFRSDSSFNFMVFFFVFFFQFVVSVVQTIGLPSSGFCGFIKGISCFTAGGAGSIIVGVLVLLVAIGFAIGAAADIFLLSRVHAIYRSTGASFAKAQQEFTTDFFRNEHVQNAASNAAQAAVRSQMGGTGGNRY